MQGGDVDRSRTEWGWLVECGYCGERFESKRADATYCCSSHRVAAKREAEQFQAWIDRLPSYGEEYIRMARKHKHSDKVFQAMLALQKQLVAALYEFETD